MKIIWSQNTYFGLYSSYIKDLLYNVIGDLNTLLSEYDKSNKQKSIFKNYGAK